MAAASRRSLYRPGRTTRGSRRAMHVGACVGLTVLMTAAPSVAASAGTQPGQPGNLLSPLALGLNAAPWDYIYAANVSAGGGLDVIQPLLKAADIGMLRYGGGSYADYYDWQTNSNIQNCLPDDATASFVVTSTSCATSDSLDFDQFSAQAKAIGAQSFVTVNYGSGTPAEAAGWVTPP
jgi:hypothetical protein